MPGTAVDQAGVVVGLVAALRPRVGYAHGELTVPGRDPVGSGVVSKNESNDRFSCMMMTTWRILLMPPGVQAGVMRGGLARRGAPVNDRLAGAGDDCGYESCGRGAGADAR